MDLSTIGDALMAGMNWSSGGLGSVLGGALGLGKWWLEAREKRKEREQVEAERQNQHKRDMALIDKEVERDTKLTQLEIQKETAMADMAGLAAAAASQDKEVSGLEKVLANTYTWFNTIIIAPVMLTIVFVQKMIRPALTIYTIILTTWIFNQVSLLIGGFVGLDNALLQGIFIQIIQTILTLTSLSFTFWFVSRPNWLQK